MPVLFILILSLLNNPVCKKQDKIALPDFFSPNQDGNNDYFIISAENVEKIHFQIFNKAGNLLYETHAIEAITTEGWDGTYHGTPQPEGVYLWSMKGHFMNGAPLNYKGKTVGTLLLIR